MALQWMLLGYVVMAEAITVLVLTMPFNMQRIVNFIHSTLLQPTFGIVPFAVFQLLDIYWKNEHRMMCTSDACTALERDRYERSIYKAQRNVVLSISACLLYWIIYRICIYHKDIQKIEDEIKRQKYDEKDDD